LLIIDNNCLSFALNVDNGIPILPFYDNEIDEELKHLTYYLNCLQESQVDDVRVHNNQAFGLMKLRDMHLPMPLHQKESSNKSLKNCHHA
jgi:hypothetical protein